MSIAEAVLQIVTAGLGSLGFVLIFHVHARHLLPAAGTGLVSWACYLALYQLTGSSFVGNLAAAILVSLLAELLARRLKAPANVFLLPGIIPLLPGGALYYTTLALLEGDREAFSARGTETVVSCLGIAAGIVVVSVVMHYVLDTLQRLSNRR